MDYTIGATERTKDNMSNKKYMHRIWLGGEMPERYARYGELWEELNPDMTLWDWTEEEIMDTAWVNTAVLQDLYTKSQQPGADLIAYYTHVADVVDYELVYRFGGWYFNTDLKPLKSLDTLGPYNGNPGLAMEDDVNAVNMAMYSPQEASFFAKVIDNLPKRYFGMPGAFMNATTGVQLLMYTLHDWYGTVYKWHRDVFNPIHWSQFEYGAVPEVEREYPSNTIAVHEWLHRTNQRGQRVLET